MEGDYYGKCNSHAIIGNANRKPNTVKLLRRDVAVLGLRDVLSGGNQGL